MAAGAGCGWQALMLTYGLEGVRKRPQPIFQPSGYAMGLCGIAPVEADKHQATPAQSDMLGLVHES